MKQVITIDPSGHVQTLLKGPVDLSKLGNISVRRSSDIMFDEDVQKFYVNFLDSDLQHMNAKARTMLFDTYEEAVAYEVERISEFRLNASREIQ